MDAELQRVTQDLGDKVTVILEDLGDAGVGKDISKRLHVRLLPNVLLIVTEEGNVIVPDGSTDDLVIILDQELRFVALGFDVKFGLVPVLAGLEGWTDDAKFHQKLQIIEPEICTLEE